MMGRAQLSLLTNAFVAVAMLLSGSCGGHKQSLFEHRWDGVRIALGMSEAEVQQSLARLGSGLLARVEPGRWMWRSSNSHIAWISEGGKIQEFNWDQNLPGFQAFERFQQAVKALGRPDFYARGRYVVAASWVRGDKARVMYAMSLPDNRAAWNVHVGPTGGAIESRVAQPEQLEEFIKMVDDGYTSAGMGRD